MSLAEQLDQLTGLLVAMTVYLIVRWAQRKWPDPPGYDKKDPGEG